jgi:hypothetical protein
MSRKVLIVAGLAVVVLIVLARRAAAANHGKITARVIPVTTSTQANIRKAAIDLAMGRG